MGIVGKGCAVIGIIGVGIFLLLVLIGTMVPRQTVDRAALLRERAEFKSRADASGPLGNRLLDCAARQVSARTVETSYLIWINERGDLTTADDRDDAARDTIGALQNCGGSVAMLTREMKADDENLIFKGLAIAMLQANR